MDIGNSRGTYIGGVWHDFVQPGDPPPEQPTEAQVTDAAKTRREMNGTGDVRDYVVSEEPEPKPAYPNVDAAVAAQRERADLVAEVQQHEADKAEREAKEKRQREIQTATAWSSDEKEIVDADEKRAAEYNAAVQRLATAKHLVATNPTQATADDHRKIADEEKRLLAEKQYLESRAPIYEQAQQLKSARREQLKFRETFPELNDDEFVEELIDWAVEHKGYSREAAMAVTDPNVLGPAVREFQQHQAAERQRHLDRPRKALMRFGPLSPTGSTPDRLTVDEARDLHAKVGNMDTALQYLTLKRERARDGR